MGLDSTLYGSSEGSGSQRGYGISAVGAGIFASQARGIHSFFGRAELPFGLWPMAAGFARLKRILPEGFRLRSRFLA